jgi:glutathione S-transferase
MPKQIELHGKVVCPYAWRTRLAAFEKGVSFDYIAFDAETPDPRAAQQNPEQRSPLLVHGDFRLTESGVIVQYIEEAFPGPALLPAQPMARARMRVDIAELAKLEADTRAGAVATPEVRARISQAHEQLERKLADGRSWLGGDSPGLSDLMIWPPLSGLAFLLGIVVPAERAQLTAYFARVTSRASYRQTRPPWAP